MSNLVEESAIRLANSSDVAAIARVLRDAFFEYAPLYTDRGFAATVIADTEVIRRMSEGPVWVASFEATIVGTVSVVRKDDSLYLRGMAVSPNARGRRVGERLLNEVEMHAKREGLRRLFLSTTPFLDRAIYLYEKSGFRRTDEGPHDLFGTPLFTMEKIIRKPT